MTTVIIQQIRCGDVYDILEASDAFSSLDTHRITEEDYDLITEAMKDFKAAQAILRRLRG